MTLKGNNRYLQKHFTMSDNQELRIKKLERSVRGLRIAFFLSIVISIIAFYQITVLASKVPSYSELKEDVKTLKKVVDAAPVVKEKAVQGYNYTKDKAVQGYNYTAEKVGQGYDYTKKKTGELIDYFTGDDEKDASKNSSSKKKTETDTKSK